MESIHPLFVHFPIALLLTAAGLDVLAVLLRRSAIHQIALWNLALGSLAAGVAVWTGLQAAEIAKHGFEIHKVMEKHEQLGIAAAVLAGVAALARILLRHRTYGWVRGASLAIMLGLAGLVIYTAHLGGRLVYEFGVGGTFAVHGLTGGSHAR
jgi:uncharacterized membrane protein